MIDEINTKLRPCPFCGGEAKFELSAAVKCQTERGNTKGWEFGICCTECSVKTPRTHYKLEVQLNDDGQISVIEDERYKAIEAWNRRASDD